MFSRKKETPEETQGRYKVEQVTVMTKQKTLAAALEAKLNEGHEKGWRLLHISGQGSPTLIVWDTLGSEA